MSIAPRVPPRFQPATRSLRNLADYRVIVKTGIAMKDNPAVLPAGADDLSTGTGSIVASGQPTAGSGRLITEPRTYSIDNVERHLKRKNCDYTCGEAFVADFGAHPPVLSP